MLCACQGCVQGFGAKISRYNLLYWRVTVSRYAKICRWTVVNHQTLCLGKGLSDVKFVAFVQYNLPSQNTGRFLLAAFPYFSWLRLCLWRHLTLLAVDSSTFLCGWLDLGNTKTALQELAACPLADWQTGPNLCNILCWLHFCWADRRHRRSDCTRIKRQLHDSDLQFLVISYTRTKAATGRCSVEAVLEDFNWQTMITIRYSKRQNLKSRCHTVQVLKSCYAKFSKPVKFPSPGSDSDPWFSNLGTLAQFFQWSQVVKDGKFGDSVGQGCSCSMRLMLRYHICRIHGDRQNAFFFWVERHPGCSIREFCRLLVFGHTYI